MNKWTRKYLKLAKVLKEDNNSCYSRSVACVLVSEDNRIISLGYNGSVSGSPHCDSEEFLDVWYDQIITDEERKTISELHNCTDKKSFLTKFIGQKQCPRHILRVPSGEKLYLCNCSHAERNALASANLSGICTKNSTMYCFCGIPCWECTQQIIQSGVKKIVCLRKDGNDYTPSSRFYLKMSKIEVEEVDPSELE